MKNMNCWYIATTKPQTSKQWGCCKNSLSDYPNPLFASSSLQMSAHVGLRPPCSEHLCRRCVQLDVGNPTAIVNDNNKFTM